MVVTHDPCDPSKNGDPFDPWDISISVDDARETSHLFQQVSVLIQRYNAVAFQGSFVEENDDVSG